VSPTKLLALISMILVGGLPVGIMAAHHESSTLQVKIIDGKGEPIGQATFRDGPHQVLLRLTVDADGLPPGWHGLHLHQVADCSDLGVFKRSGGHLGKIEGGHGLLNEKGPEDGDLPNIWVAADGTAGYEATTLLNSLDPLKAGAALVIHEREDDHISQPIGGAGPRIACAEIGG